MPTNPSVGVSVGRLAHGLAELGATLRGDAEVLVSDVRQDSRTVGEGELFVARKGTSTSGARYSREAVHRGATAVLVERGTSLGDLGVPILEVDDVRAAIGQAAEIVMDFPTRALEVVGVTGTNGKTTVSFLAEAAIRGGGGRPARLGTLGYAFGADVVETPLTTPEADEVSRYAARTRDAGGSHLLMEVSSHALVQRRVDAVEFAVAAFTNLTQDHLDYHGSMEDYGAAKARLFTELSPRRSVVNVDDPFGERLAVDAPGLVSVSRKAGADVCLETLTSDAGGIRARVRTPLGSVEVASRLVGNHNVDNLLTALAIGAALDVDIESAARALGAAPAVPGRLERCDGPEDDIVVVVDYAHTPDALARALDACRDLTDDGLWCVFGCGGDRDAAKRPLMGAAVSRRADHAVVTNDNPRSEDPRSIADAIERGMTGDGLDYVVELDRSAAISVAISKARPGDVVLVAGKGHEPYQILGENVIDFDDRVEARQALARRRRGSRQ